MLNRLGNFVPKAVASEVKVVRPSSILPALPKVNVSKPVTKEIYTSPFAPINIPKAVNTAADAGVGKILNFFG